MFFVFQFSEISPKRNRFVDLREKRTKQAKSYRNFGTNIFGFRTRDLTQSRIPLSKAKPLKQLRT